MSESTLLEVRHAVRADADLLLRWANDPAVRRASRNSASIDPETHAHWLDAKLASPDTCFLVCEQDGRPVGYARVERVDGERGELSVSVDEPFRGRGYGPRLIRLASARARSELGIPTVVARVKQENESSLRAFEGAGFEVEGSAGDSELLRLVQRDVAPVPHSRPWVGDEEAVAAAEVVRTRRLAQGERATELEGRWRELTGAAAACCVGSGLGALRLALHGLGVGAGDEVVVPAYSCVALLNAPLALGATPVLADVEPETWTIAPEDVARKLSDRTRALVAVHLFGAPARLAELASLGVPVVEDCAHGVGGRSDAGPFGGATQASVGSFYATKLVAAGEGGIVAARDPAVVERVRAARDYGDQAPNALHLNDKLTDVEAAVAQVQLSKLPELLERRRARAMRYHEALRPLVEADRIVCPPCVLGRVWYRYAVRLVDREATDVVERMRRAGVNAEQPVWDLRATVAVEAPLPGTDEAFRRLVSLPLYPDLEESEQERVVDALAHALDAR